jgi:hypothetical protein
VSEGDIEGAEDFELQQVSEDVQTNIPEFIEEAESHQKNDSLLKLA